MMARAASGIQASVLKTAAANHSDPPRTATRRGWVRHQTSDSPLPKQQRHEDGAGQAARPAVQHDRERDEEENQDDDPRLLQPLHGRPRPQPSTGSWATAPAWPRAIFTSSVPPSRADPADDRGSR